MTSSWLSYKPPSCASCGLAEQPGPCWGAGDPGEAKLIYIAQNPGKEEVNARPMAPLIGPSGRVFNRQLFEAGIRRRDLFITNQVKCLTPGNREPTDEEVDCCRPLLARELQRCRADTVLLAGATAFQANIGDYSTLSPEYHPSTSIFERMGCVEQRRDESGRLRKYIGTVHPAHVMRFMGTSIYGEAISHLRKAWAIAGRNVPIPKIIIDPTPEDINRHSTSARENHIFADDVEAYQPEGVSDEDVVADPTWTMDICGFSAIDYQAIVLDKKDLRQAWGDVWSDHSILQCEHNGESDRAHLERVAPQLNRRFDTMLAHHLLHNNIHKYLKPEVLRTYTNLPYYNRDIEGMVGRKFYCGMDNITTLLAAKEQLRLMRADTYTDVRGLEGEAGAIKHGRLLDLYFGSAFPGEPGLGEILPLLEEQRREGINVNLRTALLFKTYLENEVANVTKQIEQLIGPFFNWRSYSEGGDVQTLFYEKWGLPKQYKKDPKTHKQRVTCDDEARKRMAEWIEAKPDRAIKYAEAAHYFTLANLAASTSKLLEYVQRISPDGRIHAHQKAHGTANFRISSKPNTQNWPDWPILRRCKSCGSTHPGGKLLKSVVCHGEEMGPGLPSMRAMVVPDNPDDLLLAVDLDQAELWPYAVNFGIKYLLDIYASGAYIYGEVFENVVGKQFFKPGLPRVKKNMTDAIGYGSLREAKAIPLGFLYGMEGEKLAIRQGWQDDVVWIFRCPEGNLGHEFGAPSWSPGEEYPLCPEHNEQAIGRIGKHPKGPYYRKEWERLNPELYAGHNWIQYEMAQRKILRPPPGLLMHFPTPDLQGVNCFGSTPAAMMLWTSAILINREFKRQQIPNTRITHTVHDSLCINVGGAQADPGKMKYVYESIVSPTLGRPLPWLKEFRYKSSATVGTMWDWQMVDYSKWITSNK